MENFDERHLQNLLREQYQDASNFQMRLQTLQNILPRMTEFYPWAFSQIVLTPGTQVLELGCGTGRLWLDNLERIPPDWNILLSDFSPGMLEEAQKNLSQSSRPFAFQVIDAQDIPCEDASFDLVIANLMLYHVPNLSRALAEIQRVLRPGGFLCAATLSDEDFVPFVKLLNDAGVPLQLGINGFTLGNAAEQLAPWFSHVELFRLDGPPMFVTDAEPLFIFARSMLSQSQYSEADFQRLREHMHQEIPRMGGVKWRMDVGLFKASR